MFVIAVPFEFCTPVIENIYVKRPVMLIVECVIHEMLSEQMSMAFVDQIHPAKKVFEHLRYFVSKNLY